MRGARELPILFSGPMVRAILEGRKTQTRRVFKHQPVPFDPPYDADGTVDGHSGRIDFLMRDIGQKFWTRYRKGDTLYVREAFMYVGGGDPGILLYRATWRDDAIAAGCDRTSIATEEPKGWKPGIHMPKSIARIRLLVTDVRVQRLQDLSEDDAIAEGVEREGDDWKSYEVIHIGWHKGEPHPHAVVPNRNPTISYSELWDALNAKRGFGWDANPWIEAVTFTRV